MKISKIERQQKNPQRYSIYVDGEFYLGVHERILLEYALYKDMEVDKIFLASLQESESQEKLYTQALNYLSYGLRSEQEVLDYLDKQLRKQAKDLESFEQEDFLAAHQPVVQAIIDRLKAQKYVDDLIYGQSYVRTAALLNQKGPRTIQADLKRKGLTDALILQALEEYPQDQAYDNALDLANKYLKTKKLAPKMMKQRLRQYLMTKGYDQDLINPLMDDLDFDSVYQAEASLLDQEAQKAWRRLSRRHEGYELQQKLKQNLFRKGFDFNAIQNWLDEQED